MSEPLTVPQDAKPVVARSVRVRNIRGKLLVAVPGQAFELSETAAFIWRSIDGHRTVRDIGTLLAQEYDVELEEAVADTGEALADFAHRGAVVL